MPSWSISSKSSKGSSTNPKPKPEKKRRQYMPQPFFNAVAEYQLLYGGDEISGIKATLRERGLNMTVQQAYEVFGNERVGGGGNYRDSDGTLWMDEEYANLIDDDDSHSSASSEDTLCSGRHHSSGGKKSKSHNHRPSPLNLTPPSAYGFDDNFVSSPNPSRLSNASFLSSTASSTLYEPSIQSSTKSSKGVRGMFGLRK